MAAMPSFANANNQNVSFKLGTAKHSVDGKKITDSQPVAIGVDYTNYIFPLNSYLDLGFSAGANVAIAYDSKYHRYPVTSTMSVGVSQSIRTDYVTGYFAPVISFKPNDIIDIYARVGASVNYFAMTLEQTTSSYLYSKDRTDTTSDTTAGLYYGGGINFSLGRKVFAGLEYVANKYDVKDEKLNSEMYYAKFGFRY
ncbi:hypothetical protein A3K86_22130 [Photobacterium jeanii]|uniref:Outer membrane protein beta-barrel domain-containing protein n=2 Tax=Photobacterium jeanii TaxID=858640 RepID=A0A178K3D5_9GAMM|nr:hypothetical protein A3K86_22130 [Photobacterium jeanii]